MSADWYRIANEAEISSPALLLYRDRIDQNIRRMLEIAGNPQRLRPHVKTHKLPQLVQAQITVGITKFKCATIAEAEMTASAGAREVMLAMPPIGPAIDRLFELVRTYPSVRFATIVDSEEAITALGKAAQKAKLSLEVFLDLDCGMHRTGIVPGAEASRLYQRITQSSGLTPGGLHVYDGHLHEADAALRTEQCEAAFAPVVVFRNELSRAGLDVPSLIAGGSPTFAIHARHADRELSPGTTVLWDFGYGDKFPELGFLPAALLLTRVISKPHDHRLCLDLGHKAVAAENPHPRVRFIELPDAVAVMHSEEHLVIETPDAPRFAIGQCLYGIPRHVCPTVALHNEAWIVEGGKATERWPIVARARRLTV
jgi:D-serine deaminase-like pyridoxal phosphate-dependent protein